MPISFQPPSSAAASLRSEPLLSPPRSHNSSEDVPFKADDDDRISLNMKKRKGHRHGRQRPFPEPAIDSSNGSGGAKYRRPRSSRKTGPESSCLPFRRVQSQPSIAPRSVVGSVELSSNPKSRARRWTVSSKAVSTRALATVVPIETAVSKRSSKGKSSSSPAMITLRRATSVGAQHRLSLTSFPPPTFGRKSSGFLSTILNTITTRHSDAAAAASETSERPGTPKSASISNSSSEVRPSTSTIAPPVRTEVVTVEPQLSFPGQAFTTQTVRRCSTRYISDDGMHEIIWDPNSSTTTSEGAAPTPQSREWALASRDHGETESLERRLSRVLMQSRRASVQGEASRRGSYWPGSEMRYAQGLFDLLDSPKLARLAQETAFRSLPRSKGSRMTLAPVTAEMNITQQMVIDPQGPQAEDGGVEFFPPLRSRSNTTGSRELHDTFPGWHAQGGEASEHPGMAVQDSSDDKTGWSWGRRRSSYGGMIGLGRHAKRRSISAGPQLCKTTIEEGIGAVEGSQYRFHESELADDDTVPLLGAT
ncbi:hypothetical protein A1O1_03445 [Capronia coronata CBS 617.96]|uniref:Uncharacterized protein n=1 Tax=Capronia coronata CBS 617.96 TaxID=1182541 RepID=W9YMB2_9EURO|nr:uncharacterized protein A1O1_03445 [Capronia coronata CBS 617.96]EXJ90346.1 hypothetical protein A1O1_03445 [Capronia coronata CBS 617.96]